MIISKILKVKNILVKQKILIGSFVFFALFSSSILVFSAPPTNKYAPGATLDPACAPSSTNCSVAVATGVSDFNTIDSSESPYTVISSDQVIYADTSSGDVEINLPEIASTFKRDIYIVKTSTANSAFVNAYASDYINETTAIQLSDNRQSLTVESVSTHQWLGTLNFVEYSVSPLAVEAATTAALTASTYDNGTAGVGATITDNAPYAVLGSINTVAVAVNDRVLIKDQATTLQNGVYVVTSLGVALASPWILTRATDSDETAEFDPQVVIPAKGNTTNKGKNFAQTTNNPTIGTDAIVYSLITQAPGTGNVTQKTTGTQATGQIPFWTATTRELDKGSSGLFFDNTNKRLGVNTASPTGILHVVNTAALGTTSLLTILGTQPAVDLSTASGGVSVILAKGSNYSATTYGNGGGFAVATGAGGNGNGSTAGNAGNFGFIGGIGGGSGGGIGGGFIMTAGAGGSGGDGIGGSFNLTAGAGTGAGVGGSFNLTAGAGGGSFNLTAGAGGGGFTLNGGSSTTTSGSFTFSGGIGSSGGTGGGFTATGGDSAGGGAGGINLTGGTASGIGSSPGNITLTAGTGSTTSWGGDVNINGGADAINGFGSGSINLTTSDASAGNGTVAIVHDGSNGTTVNTIGLTVTNSGTNTSTNSITKTAITINSTGTFTGAGGGATNNYGLYINEPTGADQNYSIYLAGTGQTRVIDSAAGGYLTNAGVWQGTSSKLLKENYEDIDFEDILAKINQLPVQKWNYIINHDSNIKHIGPYSQDFYSIFEIGDDNEHLNALDTSGVALAGIKALSLKVTDLETQIQNIPQSSGGISIQDVKDFLASTEDKIFAGLVSMKALVVETLKIGSPEKRVGITLYDETTGDPYCITVVSGSMINRPGECSIVNAPTPDTTPPTITLIGDTTITLTIGDIYTELGATAVDDIDGDITANIIITGTVDTATEGSYTIYYNITDIAGNNAVEVTRTIIVAGATIPPNDPPPQDPPPQDPPPNDPPPQDPPPTE